MAHGDLYQQVNGVPIWRYNIYQLPSGGIPTPPGGTLNPVSVSANYSASVNDWVLCATTGGGITVTLPASPADKSVVGAVRYVGTNNVTITAGGTDKILLATGLGTSNSLLLQGETYVWQYDALLAVWLPRGNTLPISQLDARYEGLLFPLLVPTTVQTANYTANANDLVLVDTTSGFIAVTLPTTPPDKTVVGAVHYAGTNTMTLNAGGSDQILGSNGLTTALGLVLTSHSVALQYDAALAAWLSVAGRLSVGGPSFTWTTAGTFNWVCPSGVTQIDVECVGGGGGGGGANVGGGAAGGSGGNYAKQRHVPVVPGHTYHITVGASGGGGAAGAAGTGGGASSFSDPSDATASGGRCGANGGLGGNPATGGTVTGATAQGKIGYETEFVAGAGGSGTVSASGAGGGGAGDAQNGQAGSGTTAGAGGIGNNITGGNGGTGLTTGGQGNPGNTPGGGGAGAFRSGGVNQAGGAGAAGMVRIMFDPTI